MADERDINDQRIWAICGAAIDYAPNPSREHVIAMNKRLTALCRDLVRTAKAQEREACAQLVDRTRESEETSRDACEDDDDRAAYNAHSEGETVARLLAEAIRKRGA